MSDLHTSIDIETLGREAGCVILSIGAVKFDPMANSGVTKDTFYRNIDVKDSERHGFKMDADTVMWWLQQDAAARVALPEDAKMVRDVLTEFANWLDPETKVWGNGSDFDNVIVAHAYRRLGMEIPWKFYNNRCLRTLKTLFPKVKVDKVGTHHNALDDAIYQAHLCQAIHKEMKWILRK